VAICEPVEVDNDDEIFGRQRIDIRGASLWNDHRLRIDPAACIAYGSSLA